ncbi:unnamed protein product [Effrenium voratum]|nr:unnamed protein product [Effrenium voratum]CAJ1415652.1 unnamed protein product [Effrenium voratum]CAJ1439395.1 unnamed protein product [Effrenium voratum]
MVNEWDEQTKSRVRALRLRGKSLREIVAETGVSKGAVQRICAAESTVERAAKKRRVEAAVAISRSSCKRAKASGDLMIVPVTVGGAVVNLHARSETTDFRSVPELFERQVYKPKDTLARQLCQSGKWQVLDVGANIGYASVCICLGLLRNATVSKLVCVEPGASNAAVLRRNLRSANLKALVLETAVSSRRGEGTLCQSNKYNFYRQTLTPVTKAASSSSVVCETALDILSNVSDVVGSLFIKLDCEGGEAHFAARLCGWISRLKKIDAVLVMGEISFDNLRLSHSGYTDLKRQFSDLNSDDWILARAIWGRAPLGTSEEGFTRSHLQASAGMELLYMRKQSTRGLDD